MQNERLRYHVRMRAWSLCAGLIAVSVGCTKANPAAKCTSSGTCTDPNYPFCDADGSIGGEPGTCIAVRCSAGAFGGCEGSNVSLICDANGLTYDPVPCLNGCDPKLGCNACNTGS